MSTASLRLSPNSVRKNKQYKCSLMSDYTHIKQTFKIVKKAVEIKFFLCYHCYKL
jgi:hypothetical protein